MIPIRPCYVVGYVVSLFLGCFAEFAWREGSTARQSQAVQHWLIGTFAVLIFWGHCAFMSWGKRR